MRFSVILPTRGRPALVGRAVSSVLEQTHEDWELVVLDNSDEPYPAGSIPSDPRIVYRWRRCEGLAHASALAVEMASGDVILPLGDDDILPPRCLEMSREAFGDALWLNGRTEIRSEDGGLLASRGGDQASVDITLLGTYWLGGAVHWRRELTLEGSYDPRYEGAADYALYLRFARSGSPALVPETMYLYTDWAGTDSRVNPQRQAAQAQRIVEEVLNAPAC